MSVFPFHHSDTSKCCITYGCLSDAGVRWGERKKSMLWRSWLSRLSATAPTAAQDFSEPATIATMWWWKVRHKGGAILYLQECADHRGVCAGQPQPEPHFAESSFSFLSSTILQSVSHWPDTGHSFIAAVIYKYIYLASYSPRWYTGINFSSDSNAITPSFWHWGFIWLRTVLRILLLFWTSIWANDSVASGGLRKYMHPLRPLFTE